MLSWPILVNAFVIVLALGGGLLTGCSSSSPQDMNKGTDVGADFVPPDGSTVSVADAADAADASDAADAAGNDASDTGLVSEDLADTNASDDAAGSEASPPEGG